MSVRVLPTLVLVLADGSAPASSSAPAPFVQTISIPQYDNAEQPYQLFQANGAPVDTTGGAFVLTARSGPWNTPMMSRQGVVIDDPTGKGKFIIGSSDTGVARGGYQCDVEYIDAAGNRWQVMPPDPVTGNLFITEALSTPTQTVTPGPGQLPIGSSIGHSDTFSDFPPPTDHPWLIWIDDSEHVPYYSDGTSWLPLEIYGITVRTVATTSSLPLSPSPADGAQIAVTGIKKIAVAFGGAWFVDGVQVLP